MPEGKLDILLAIVKADCDLCHREAWLYIPGDSEYVLLCETCMNELNLSLDIVATKKELAGE